MTTYGRTNAVTGGGGTPTPTQTKEVQATAFPTVVTPDEGYALSQVTVTAPANLTPENIKAGVSIAGVAGTLDVIADEFITKLGKLVKSSITDVPIGTQYEEDIIMDENFMNNLNGIFRSIMGNIPIISGPIASKVEIPDNFHFNSSFITAISNGYEINSAKPRPVEYIFKGTFNVNTGYPLICRTVLQNFPSTYPVDKGRYFSQLFDNSTILDDTFIIPEGITELGNYFVYKHYTYEGTTATQSPMTVIFPSTMQTIVGTALSSSNSKNNNIIVLNPTPPTLTSTGQGSGYNCASITVPNGSLEAYQSATNWSAFADIMQEATE